MRILVDVRHLTQPQQGGVGEYTVQLLNALFEIDSKNEYILFSSGKTPAQKTASITQTERVKFVHLPIPNKLLNLRTLLLGHPTLNWRIREPIDLIFMPNMNITSLPSDIPTVLTVHDLSWHFFPEFYSQKMKFWHKAVRPAELIKKADVIITPSNSTKQDVHTVFGKPLENIAVIPHGFDQLFSPKIASRDHGVRSRFKLPSRFALFMGTLEPRKNLLGLIEGVKQYREQTHDDLHLVLAGKMGWKPYQLKKRLMEKDVNGWIHQLEYIQNEDRPALYRSATALTWPSIYEGFGLPILEAMASGTPIISSHTSSISELVQDAGIMIDPYNPTDIAEALRGLLSSKSLQQRLKEKGLARAQQFSWRSTAQETIKVFQSF